MRRRSRLGAGCFFEWVWSCMLCVMLNGDVGRGRILLVGNGLDCAVSLTMLGLQSSFPHRTRGLGPCTQAHCPNHSTVGAAVIRSDQRTMASPASLHQARERDESATSRSTSYQPRQAQPLHLVGETNPARWPRATIPRGYYQLITATIFPGRLWGPPAPPISTVRYVKDRSPQYRGLSRIKVGIQRSISPSHYHPLRDQTTALSL